MKAPRNGEGGRTRRGDTTTVSVQLGMVERGVLCQKRGVPTRTKNLTRRCMTCFSTLSRLLFVLSPRTRASAERRVILSKFGVGFMRQKSYQSWPDTVMGPWGKRYATRPGTRFLPGASWTPEGVNFSVFSRKCEQGRIVALDSADSGEPVQFVVLDRECSRSNDSG